MRNCEYFPDLDSNVYKHVYEEVSESEQVDNNVKNNTNNLLTNINYTILVIYQNKIKNINYTIIAIYSYDLYKLVKIFVKIVIAVITLVSVKIVG